MPIHIYWLIFLPLLTGVAIYALDKPRFNSVVYWLQAALSLLFFGVILPPIMTAGFKPLLFVAGNWSNVVGVAFKVDGLTLLFVTMTLLAFWYIWLYILPKQQNDHKYLFFLCILQSALLGLFTTDDLFAIFVLIELVTILASLLVTYKKDAHSVRAGLFYLMYSSWGMLIYLFGTICLYWYTGNMNIALSASALSQYQGQPVLTFAIAAMLTGLGLKSGFFMLHYWLPQAHTAAPANISAVLSGLIAKMGIFAMLRITGLLALADVQGIFMIVGVVSGISGAAFAMVQSDMKRILAFHTVSQLGLVFLAIGIGGEKNLFGAYAHLFNHFTFKSLLFLTVGVIIADTNERRVKKIRGLWQFDKRIALLLGLGIVSIMGLPFTSASFSKLLIKSGSYSKLTLIALYAINLGTIISFVKLATMIFGQKSEALIGAKRRSEHTFKALYFIGAVVLLALPVELWLSATYKPELLSYFGKKAMSDGLTFALMLALGALIYKHLITRVIKRFPHLGHGDVAFGPAVASSALFLLGALVWLWV